MNVKGHRRTDANQQSPHLVAPANGAAGPVPVDSPITPANAINNTNLGSPGVPDRTAHLLKHGVVKIRLRTPARVSLCEWFGDLGRQEGIFFPPSRLSV
jgi:hypothetical protein